MSTKKCSKCGIVKNVNEFTARSDCNGYLGRCKPCNNEHAKDYYYNNDFGDRGFCTDCGADKNNDSQAVSKELCRSCYTKLQTVRALAKTDKNCIICSSNSTSKWYSGPTCRKCYRNTNNKKNKEENNNTHQIAKLKNNIRSRFHSALSGNSKTGSAVDELGCSIEFFKEYLAKQFIEEMSWDNYGKSKAIRNWEIDHIVPLAVFDLTDIEELKKACHYTNQQPLWAKANNEKGTAYENKEC